MGSPVLSFTRLAVYLGFTLALMPVQVLFLLTSRRLAAALPRVYHRACLAILGFRVERIGRPNASGPTLFVANHSSYLDIAVLGAMIAGSFVAKAEVAGWPLFGWLARLQRTVFVDRRPGAVADHRDGIAARLAAGDDLILFPEGTSSDGNRTLPFKSALFSVAEQPVAGRPLAVQPVSIAYVRLNGMPIGHSFRPLFAWYGDMDLAGHMLRVAGLGQVTVVVEFHDPVSIADFASRKGLARHCHRAVANGLARAISGRPGPSAEAASPPAVGVAPVSTAAGA